MVELLMKNIIMVALIYLIVLIFGMALFIPLDPLIYILGLVLGGGLFEAVIRILLYIKCGPNYIFRILPYFLVSDKKYGYNFRKNVKSKNIDFRLYEKYAFRPGDVPPDDSLDNKKARVDLNTNAYGLRGGPVSDAKSSDVRILCSGGSTTAGQGLDDFETWPAQLQEQLLPHGVDAEVINAGVYGFDSYQELLRLQDLVPRLKPDVVVLHQGWNEEFNYASLELGSKYKPREARGYLEKYFYFSNNLTWFPNFLISALLIYRELRRGRMLRGSMSFGNWRRWHVLKSREYLESWFDNICEVVDLCERHGAGLFLVDYPSLVDIYDSSNRMAVFVEGSRLTPEHAWYQALAKARVGSFLGRIGSHLHVIDCAGFVRRMGAAERLSYFVDEIHMNAAGEKALGAEVAAALLREEEFVELIGGGRPAMNVLRKGAQKEGLLGLRPLVGTNSQFVNLAINRFAGPLFIAGKGEAGDTIPTDVYTTS